MNNPELNQNSVYYQQPKSYTVDQLISKDMLSNEDDRINESEWNKYPQSQPIHYQDLQHQILSNLLEQSRQNLTEQQMQVIQSGQKLSEMKVYWSYSLSQEEYNKNMLSLYDVDQVLKFQVAKRL